MIYKERLLEKEINELFKVFQVVAICGPRQSGKSTMLKNLKGKWEYFNLDDRVIRNKIVNDVDLFVRDFQSNIIIDEAQKIPDLFHAIKAIVDKGFPHKIILSGSSNFLLLQSITESLAGRIGILELLPFSFSEASSIKSSEYMSDILHSTDINELHKKIKNKKQVAESELIDFILYGGFPKIHSLDNVSLKERWFQGYITTYIEKDIRDLMRIANLGDFQNVYNILAYRTGNVLNLSNISSDIGVNIGTLKNYLQLLESSYQYKKIFPFLSTPKKSITKHPKIFGFDTGMLNFILKNFDRERMFNSGFWGNILETWVFSEIYKSIKDLSSKPNLNFYRTKNHAEVDFVLRSGKKLIPIEVKTSYQISHLHLRGINSFMDSYDSYDIPYGIVIHRGEKVSFLSDKILGLPITLIY